MLIRGVKGTLFASLGQHNVKVAHISHRYGAYLNLDEKMIARAPIFDLNLNLKMNQEALDWVYLDYQCKTFKIHNTLVYQILSKVFTDMDAMST